MEIFTVASAFFLKAFLWFSAATLAIQIGVVVAAFLAVAAFVGLIYKLATYSKVSERASEPASEPVLDPVLEPIPQEIEDIYYGKKMLLLGPGPKTPPVAELNDNAIERPPSSIYLNKANWTYYHDPEFTMPHHKEHQAEIDRQEHPEMSPTIGLRKFAEQYKKNKP